VHSKRSITIHLHVGPHVRGTLISIDDRNDGDDDDDDDGSRAYSVGMLRKWTQRSLFCHEREGHESNEPKE